MHSESLGESVALQAVHRPSPWRRGEDLGEGLEPHNSHTRKQTLTLPVSLTKGEATVLQLTREPSSDDSPSLPYKQLRHVQREIAVAEQNPKRYILTASAHHEI
jgi:hypothetical protein